MTETLFHLANGYAFLGWLCLALIPLRYRLARHLAVGVATTLALFYVALVVTYWNESPGDFYSLAGLSRVFDHPGLLLAGWVHYLAFDLLVGTWQREEAVRIGLSRWVLLPCLAVAFVIGPVGWLLFLACRHFRLRTAGPATPRPGH